jgi:hypothetical protein
MSITEQYDELMGLFENIKREVKTKNPNEYERWKAYGFQLDDTFVSMGPNLGEIVEKLEEEFDE